MDYQAVATRISGNLPARRVKSAFWAISVAVVATLSVMCGTSAPGTNESELAAVAETPETLVWGDKISCTSEARSTRERYQEVLLEVRDRYHDALKVIPGVIGAGVGYIYEDGKRTGRIGIIVHFDPEKTHGYPDAADLIPDEIEGCAVGVQPPARPQPAGG